MRKLTEKKFQEFINKIKTQVLDNQNTIIRLNDEVFDTRLCLIKNSNNDIFLGIFNSKDDVKLKNIPLTEGLLIQNAQESRQNGVVVLLEKGHDKDIFFQFILHITNELFVEMSGRKTSEKLFKILSSWQGFFNRRRKPISRNNQLALMGELKVLELIVLNTVDNVKGLNSWQGPNNGLHDFVLPKCNLEVKSSSDKMNIKFTIHGEKQLDDIPNKNLYLINPIFELNTEGPDLYQYITYLKNKLGNEAIIQLFENMIYKAGFRKMHKTYYNEEGLRLKFQNFMTYRVDKNFPRIIADNSPKDIVVDAYTISSQACKDSIVEISKVEEDITNGS